MQASVNRKSSYLHKILTFFVFFFFSRCRFICSSSLRLTIGFEEMRFYFLNFPLMYLLFFCRNLRPVRWLIAFFTSNREWISRGLPLFWALWPLHALFSSYLSSSSVTETPSNWTEVSLHNFFQIFFFLLPIFLSCSVANHFFKRIYCIYSLLFYPPFLLVE